MAPQTAKQWLLAKQPTDMPHLDGPSATFKLATDVALPDLKDGQVLLKTLYLSNDPAQRGWISASIPADRLYVPPVKVGTPMHARGIAEVVESRADSHKPGMVVAAGTNWTDYCVLDAKDCPPLPDIAGLGKSHFLGALGTTGLTAYYGLVEIARAKKEDTVVVSGAAGATGSMVVQIAKKMVGCKKVIGMAGSDEKCRWVEKLGADVCLNYKSPTFKEDLNKATAGYVEVYFDNVGGEILDMMLARMKTHGRVAACGSISGYNSESTPYGIKNWFEVITNRIEIRGFIVLDYLHKRQEVVGKFVAAIKEGKLSIGDENETVVPTAFEDIPKTWMKLFEGSNTGKLVTKL